MGQLALIGCIRSDLARGRANGFYAQGDNAEAAWLSGVALTLLIVFEHVWIPEDPVPMTATRLPANLTSSCGHRPVK